MTCWKPFSLSKEIGSRKAFCVDLSHDLKKLQKLHFFYGEL